MIAITPLKVIEVGTNRKPVCDFLLVINSNWQGRRHGVDWGTLLPETVTEIDADPASFRFFFGWGRG